MSPESASVPISGPTFGSTSGPSSGPGHGGSPSLGAPEYWWYTARGELLSTVLSPFVGAAETVLDVGSADGPSADWLEATGRKVTLDIDPRGLIAGGVCGSALELPFRDETFDVVGAFDVVEHCDPESLALAELFRVLKPGGRLLISVPAYEWAWTEHDDLNGHHRRYTRPRAVAAVRRAGARVDRATYIFSGTFPLFAAERLARRLRRAVSGGGDRAAADIADVPEVSRTVERVLLRLCRIDRRLVRGRDLPFGSSVVVAATKP